MIDLLDQSDAPMRMAQIRVLGGAAARVPVDATAYAHRKCRMLVAFIAMGGPDAVARNEEWVGKCLLAADQGVAGAYVNFVAEEGPARVRDAYPAQTWKRLQQVKRRYDPENIFRLNQNVTPGDEDAA